MKLLDLHQKNPERAPVLFAGLASAAFLVTALVGQYGFNLHPCELCIAQRVPYILILMIVVAALAGKVSVPCFKQLAVVCGLLLFIDGGIAVYHSGVELGIFPGPSGCTNNGKSGETIEELRAAIMNAQAVPCDQPMVYVLGLSMASWNALAAAVSGIVTFTLLKKNRNYAG